MKYYIENMGCDDITKAIVEMSDNELETFIKICKELNKKSTSQCQPSIAIYRYDECEIEQYEDDTWIYTNNAKDLLEER